MKKSDVEKRMADYLNNEEAIQEEVQQTVPATEDARDIEMERRIKELESLAAKRLDNCVESSSERARDACKVAK